MPEFLTANQHKLLASAVVVVTLWLVHRIIFFLVNRRLNDPRSRSIWRQGASYLILLGALIGLTQIWFEQFQAIFTVLSLVAAALVIIHKEPVLNFTGWIAILWRNLFAVGDSVSIKDRTGVVTTLGLFYFTLAETGGSSSPGRVSGRVIKVPNSLVFSELVTNHSHGLPYVWNEVTMPITAASNWKKAEELLKAIIDEWHVQPSQDEIRSVQSSELDLVYRDFSSSVRLRPAAEGLHVSGRYLCKPHKLAQSEDRIWHSVLERIAIEEDITLTALKA